VSVPEERQEGPARSAPLQCIEGDVHEGGDEDIPKHDGEVNNYDDPDLVHP
jgi:hypothetical protein